MILERKFAKTYPTTARNGISAAAPMTKPGCKIRDDSDGKNYVLESSKKLKK